MSDSHLRAEMAEAAQDYAQQLRDQHLKASLAESIRDKEKEDIGKAFARHVKQQINRNR